MTELVRDRKLTSQYIQYNKHSNHFPFNQIAKHFSDIYLVKTSAKQFRICSYYSLKRPRRRQCFLLVKELLAVSLIDKLPIDPKLLRESSNAWTKKFDCPIIDYEKLPLKLLLHKIMIQTVSKFVLGLRQSLRCSISVLSVFLIAMIV